MVGRHGFCSRKTRKTTRENCGKSGENPEGWNVHAMLDQQKWIEMVGSLINKGMQAAKKGFNQQQWGCLMLISMVPGSSFYDHLGIGKRPCWVWSLLDVKGECSRVISEVVPCANPTWQLKTSLYATPQKDCSAKKRTKKHMVLRGHRSHVISNISIASYDL